MPSLPLRVTLRALALLAGTACRAPASSPGAMPAAPATPTATAPFQVVERAKFAEPWAMAALPDGRLLITTKPGKLWLFDPHGAQSVEITGVAPVAYGGQGGLGDIALAPDFATSHRVYLSSVEAGNLETRGAVVDAYTRDLTTHTLSARTRIWTQSPKVEGEGHFSHRLLFSPDGRFLYITSGERQKFTPAQAMTGNLGKVLRLYPDGNTPPDNPFAAQGGVAAQVWTLGHRNPLGLVWDAQGRLWQHEMGPRGGDELNLIVRGRNYGWPVVSNGDHYTGRTIPDHPTHPEFEAPKAWWSPVISPSSLVIYGGDRFPAWRGHALITGLSSQGLIDVQLDGENAREVARHDFGHRLREIEATPDGGLWILEDGENARLLELTTPTPRSLTAPRATPALP